MQLLNPDYVKWVILHTSGSPYGDLETIDRWHRERGFSSIGYHWVITNIYPTYNSYSKKKPDISFDGLVHAGRPEKFVGAHVKGHNSTSIGIVMIGAGGVFTSRQLMSAAKLINQSLARFPNAIGVRGHYEFNPGKTCPDVNMNFFRRFILSLGERDEKPTPLFDPSIYNRVC